QGADSAILRIAKEQSDARTRPTAQSFLPYRRDSPKDRSPEIHLRTLQRILRGRGMGVFPQRGSTMTQSKRLAISTRHRLHQVNLKPEAFMTRKRRKKKNYTISTDPARPGYLRIDYHYSWWSLQPLRTQLAIIGIAALVVILAVAYILTRNT